MSLEEAIEDLIREIRSLSERLEKIARQRVVMLDQMEEGLETFADTIENAGMTETEQPLVEHEEPPVLAEGENPQVLALIALAKEMGYDYLYHEGQLVVDNRVMDEFNRRNLTTGSNDLDP